MFATNRKRKEKSEQDTIQLTNLFLRRNVQKATVSVVDRIEYLMQRYEKPPPKRSASDSLAHQWYQHDFQIENDFSTLNSSETNLKKGRKSYGQIQSKA